MASPTGTGTRRRQPGRAHTLRPTTSDELRHALLDTAAGHHRIGVHGAGTAAAWASRPAPADAAIDTTAMNGILRYNPADMTVAVLAGTTLRDLQAAVGEHGQRVAFDPAREGGGATVGGLLATADGGPSRHAYGTLRDLVIGVTVVLADGTLARSGGHVIKNVAGYDLAKLFHGSFGTLGVVSEVVLRLHPAPRATAGVAIDVPVPEAHALARAIVTTGLDPAALELTCSTAGAGEIRGGRLLVRFGGTPRGVDQRAGAVPALTTHPVHRLDDDHASRSWSEVAEVAVGERGDTVLRVGSLPGDGARLIEWIAATAQSRSVAVSVASTVLAGVHTVRLRGGDASAHAELLRAVHAAVGSACTVLRRDGLDPATPVWGAPPRAVALMRAVKRQFDPHDRFGTSRLAPWLDPHTGTERSA